MIRVLQLVTSNDEEEDMATFNLPKHLKAWRKRMARLLGIPKSATFTQREAAECVPCPRNTYRNWEEGRRAPGQMALDHLRSRLKLIELTAEGLDATCEDCDPKVKTILRRIVDEHRTEKERATASSKAA
jgi:DNA-binding transcriptional regulator YiaG